MGDTSTDPTHSGVRARRDAVRADTFARRRAESQHFATPAWLDRSFVLPVQPSDPVTEAPVSEATAPEAPAPRHVPAREWPDIVRPPSAEVDFATMVRRADAYRLARRTALFTLALTTLILGVMVLTGSTAALPLMAVSGAGMLVSGVVLVVLSHAPVPRLDS
ncbi:MAG TPA: hypothetical protein VFJ28_01780 [Marmoricola sp.]|nr:hypothetical protein [Marmoricola sp.]